MNSRGCQPTVTHSEWIRPRKGSNSSAGRHRRLHLRLFTFGLVEAKLLGAMSGCAPAPWGANGGRTRSDRLGGAGTDARRRKSAGKAKGKRGKDGRGNVRRAGSTPDGTDAPRDHPSLPSEPHQRAPVLSNPLVIRRQTPLEAISALVHRKELSLHYAWQAAPLSCSHRES